MAKPPAKIPILYDTREQVGHVWQFNADRFEMMRGTLVTGDYSVVGFEDTIAVERKALGDAVNTFIHQWTRFRRELNRLSAMDHPLIVIEATLEDILAHRYESDAEPAAVLGRINGILIDHGIPVILAGIRELAITLVESWITQCVKKCGGLP